MNPLPAGEVLALEMAQAADAAARQAIDGRKLDQELVHNPAEVAVACGASTRAWAGFARMLKPNGEQL